MNHKLLKELRLERGFTQKEMADALGYAGKSGYNMLETGNVGSVSVEISMRIKAKLQLSEKEYRRIFLEG